jgi:adenine-specific DNA-methyltransferase
VNIIYIDPPYNTGNDDFTYNDKIVDKEDTFRHTKWLNSLEPRLILAKNLLTEDGVLFFHIGDDELANSILLLDSVFGEGNRISIVTRHSKSSSDQGNFFAPSTDYILIYAKYINAVDNSTFRVGVNAKNYKKKDNNGFFTETGLFQNSLASRPNQRYYIECPDGSLCIPPGTIFPTTKQEYSKISPTSNNDKIWRWTPETYQLNKSKNKIVFKQTKKSPLIDENGSRSKWNIYVKSYLNEREKSGVKPRTLLTDPQFLNTTGTNELKKFGIKFSYAKPVSLIKYLIKLAAKPNDVVLDFFAGSGTTGQAVLELNKETTLNLQCILCTNNENNICSNITFPRLKGVIQGTPKYKAVGGNLTYYKVKNFDVKAFLEKDPGFSESKAVNDLLVDLLVFHNETLNMEHSDDKYKIYSSNNNDLKTCIVTELYPTEDEIKTLLGNVEKFIKEEKQVILVVAKGFNKGLVDESSENLFIREIPQELITSFKRIHNMVTKKRGI